MFEPRLFSIMFMRSVCIEQILLANISARYKREIRFVWDFVKSHPILMTYRSDILLAMARVMVYACNCVLPPRVHYNSIFFSLSLFVALCAWYFDLSIIIIMPMPYSLLPFFILEKLCVLFATVVIVKGIVSNIINMFSFDSNQMYILSWAHLDFFHFGCCCCWSYWCCRLVWLVGRLTSIYHCVANKHSFRSLHWCPLLL